ncbi:MAG TPA: LON peptidase substrate-binding domain-containing protein, partial [Bacillota bacterium]|nr:LON peptidase substrate-binding domain-containing protein [Bacillota bacterium]
MLIIPISDLVLLPGMSYVLKLKRLSEEELANIPDNAQSIVALTLKKYKNKPEITPEDFYKVGVTLEIQEMKDQE